MKARMTIYRNFGDFATLDIVKTNDKGNTYHEHLLFRFKSNAYAYASKCGIRITEIIEDATPSSL